jgi:hypothetical protein
MPEKKKVKLMARFLWTAISCCLLFATLALTADAQKREHLTPEEIEIIRDTQDLDKRTEVFVKAINRRLTAINGGVEIVAAKKVKKDNADWGALPTGTKPQLIYDIADIMEEAMDNIDLVYTRDEKNPLIAKALKTLSESALQLQTALKPFEKTNSGEADAAKQALDKAEQILKAQAEFSAARKPVS